MLNKLEWQRHTFQQLSNHLLYEIIKLRVDVFVVEQNCPYAELDNKDQHPETIHITATLQSELVAYARILPPDVCFPKVSQEVSMGRFIVKAPLRRKGIGSELLSKCLAEKFNLWPNYKIKISAQKHLTPYYEHFGFRVVSESYLEDGIPHIEMLKDPP
jgi:ElaA protein